MTVGVGVSKKITESGFYNLSVALPFICAFYIMNTSNVYIIPIINISLNYELSILIDILIITFWYYVVIAFVLMITISSSQIEQNNFFIWAIIVFLFLSILGCFIIEDGRGILSIITCVYTSIFLLLYKLNFNQNAEKISLGLSLITGGLISLILFMSGILWYFNKYVFIDAIQLVLNLSEINPSSYLLGSLMFIATGYSTFYGLFVLDIGKR